MPKGTIARIQSFHRTDCRTTDGYLYIAALPTVRQGSQDKLNRLVAQALSNNLRAVPSATEEYLPDLSIER